MPGDSLGTRRTAHHGSDGTTMRPGSNIPAVGGYNQAVTLDAVRRAPEGVSRVEIAQATGLSAQTVTNIVRRLLREGLVAEAGTRTVGGVGKPRTILRLEPRSRLAVGVHLDPSVITIVLLDLAGEVVSHRVLQTSVRAKAPRTLERIASGVQALIAESGADRNQVLGVGVASPGPIDLGSGVVLNPPLLTGWHDVPIRDELARLLDLPVILEKDVTAAAVAELWMDTTGERNDMLFFYCGTGIGGGIVARGEVIRGFSNNAGDIGAIIVGGNPDRPRGRRWRLGNSLMPSLMVAEAAAGGISPGGPDGMAADEVRAAYAALVATADDPRAHNLVGDAVTVLAEGLVILVNLLDLDHVVFGGPFFAPLREIVLERVPGLVMGSSVYTLPHPVTFTESAIGEDVAAIGAACLVLDGLLSPRPQTLLIGS
ncbi:MAG: ROK family transcriptional regulator [Microbacteriaceae bacterium]|nr:ROK family transcriptional regulator [Microbacteriaceae bacterium]